MSKTAKIPDMFLRALKRRNESVEELGHSTTKRMNTDSSKTPPTPKIEETPSVSDDNIKNVDSTEFRLFDLLKEESWRTALTKEFEKSYMVKVEEFLRKEYSKNVKIFPPKNEIFTVFNVCPLDNIRVVIIGQDPYHNDGQAHGLSFSVKKGIKLPPSLKNIYKELADDIKTFKAPDHGYLMGWAKQGVFMLNATLTVEAHKANSHEKIGWQTFTDNVIKLISSNTEHVVFVLWGGFAHKKEALIDGKKHGIIKCAHPSPLSARHWWGSRSFSKTNDLLNGFGRPPIDWSDLRLD